MDDTSHTPRSEDDSPIDRYLRGRTTVAERAAVEHDMRGAPRFMAWVAAIRAWRVPRDTELRADRIYAQIARETGVGHVGVERAMVVPERTGVGTPQSSIAKIHERAGEHRAPARDHRNVFRRTVVGAAVVAVVALMLLVWPTQHHAAGITRTYATGAGERATLTLGDGTNMTLSPHTRVRLVDFGQHNRTIDIEGEAYFETRQASEAPFVVRSGRVSTRVLGTAFLVRHYPGDRAVHVAVTQGRVQVTAHASTEPGIRLSAGMFGDVTDSIIQTTTLDELVPEVRWNNGVAVFQHVPVSKMLDALGKWYGYQFRCPDSTVTQQVVTIAVSMRSAASALAVVEQLLDVNLTVVGDTVTLTPQQSRSSHPESRAHPYDLWTPTREVGR